MSIPYDDKSLVVTRPRAAAAPLVRVTPCAARPRPRPPLTAQNRHRRVYSIVGSIGVGLCIIGWQVYGSSDLGFVGLCIIGIVAIFSAWASGGEKVAPAQQQATIPPPSITQAWATMTRQERLHTWGQLTDVQKVTVIADALKQQQEVKR